MSGPTLSGRPELVKPKQLEKYMPSPVGHIIGGAAVYLAGTRREHHSTKLFMITLLGSIVPDFDFLPGILIGDAGAFHHGVSHSLSFAALFGALGFFFFRCFQKKIAVRAAVLATVAYAFHVVLDAVNVNEGARGVPLFWPLSDVEFASNLHLLGHFHHDRLEQGIWSVVRRHNLSALTREVTVLGIPVVLLLLWRKSRDRASNSRRESFK